MNLGLPMTPFARVPENRWVSRPYARVKPRLDISDLLEDDEVLAQREMEKRLKEIEDEEARFEEQEESSEEEWESDEDDNASVDSDDEVMDIEELMEQATREARQRLATVVEGANIRRKPKPLPKPFTIVYRVLRRWYMNWYKRQQAARLHPAYREYADKVKRYEKKLKQEFKDELKNLEKEVMDEALKTKKRIERSLKKKNKGVEQIHAHQEEVTRRNKEAERLDFNCINMQRWAGEAFDREQEAKEQAVEQANLDRKLGYEAQVAAEIAADDAEIKEDIRTTQEVFTLMRRSGLKEGVNLESKVAHRKKKSVDRMATSLNITLNPEVNLEWQPKYEYIKVQREGIFNHKLHKYKFVKKLVCSRIGEKGALALAADFISGAIPQLTELDVSYCQIQSRGLGRLLHGIRVANINGLEKLVLRGNDITAKGMSHLEAALALTTFANLRVLDLRYNELGDVGAHVFAAMATNGHLSNIQEALLQNNMITDIGFDEITIMFASIKDAKCPNLTRLNLTNNLVSGSLKKKRGPFPSFLVV